MKKYLNSFIFLLILFIVVNIQEYFPAKSLFAVYSSLLIIYLIIEIVLVRISDKADYLLNPVVLASFFTFMLSFGLTNYLFLDENSHFNYQLYDRLGQNAFRYLANAMPLVIIGAISMWAGFHSGLGRHLFQFMTTSIIPVKKYFRKSFEIRFNLVLSFIILSILSRILAIYLGIFGYAQDPDIIKDLSAFDLPLNILGELGKFCLLIVSLAYFSSPENKKYKIIFLMILVVELFFGILSGMKIGLMMPFVILLFTNYLINKKLKKTYFFYFLIATALAYAIIEPFRVLRWYDPNFKSTPGYILSTFTEAYSLSQKIGLGQAEFAENVFLAAFMRTNYVIEIAKAKEYEDNVGLKDDDPDFKFNLFASPLIALVPRALWPDKPIQSLGNWFTRKVWGWDIESSTAMTPFGFLYFAGGIPFIIFFLFIVGIMQESLVKFMKLGSGGAIIFIGLLTSVVVIDSNVSGIFISWLRLFPILLFLQYFVFKR